MLVFFCIFIVNVIVLSIFIHRINVYFFYIRYEFGNVFPLVKLLNSLDYSTFCKL